MLSEKEIEAMRVNVGRYRAKPKNWKKNKNKKRRAENRARRKQRIIAKRG